MAKHLTIIIIWLTCIAAFLSLSQTVNHRFESYAEPRKSIDTPLGLNTLVQASGGRYFPQLFKLLGSTNGTGILISNPGFEVKMSGFGPGASWSRQVSHALHAGNSGKLSFSFPENKASLIGIYLTDGDSFWRMSRVVSGGQRKLATELHNGRWIFMEVTPEENKKGTKDVEIYRLTGDSIAISAVAILIGKKS